MPDPLGLVPMVAHSVAWAHSILPGRRLSVPLATTAPNFIDVRPLALLVDGGAALLGPLRYDATA